MKKNQQETSNIAATSLAIVFALVTILLGLYGFNAIYVAKDQITHSEWTHWFDVIYSTLRLFSMESAPEDDGNSAYWAISLARVFAAITIFYSIALATFLGFKGWFQKNLYVRTYRNHYIVLGINDESIVLIKDLLKHNKKVIVVGKESPSMSIPKNCINLSGQDVTLNLLIKSGLLRAKAIVCMSSIDIDNLTILDDLISSKFKPELQFFIRLENSISFKLFEPTSFYAIDNIREKSPGLYLTVFNPNEFAAIDLLRKLIPGSTINTTDKNSEQVTLVILGLAPVGRAVVREILLMAHFCNGQKAKILIVNDKPENKALLERENPEIFKNCNNKGLDLWDIEFLDSTLELDQEKTIHHIISCYENDNKSLEEIFSLYDKYIINREIASSIETSFHYYNASGFDIHHEKITAFGSPEKTMTYESIINGFDEKLARKSHEDYARRKLNVDQSITHKSLDELLVQHDSQTPNSSLWLHWANQPLFKRRANFTEKRHFNIKLQYLGGQIPVSTIKRSATNCIIALENYPFLTQLNDININILKNWLSYILKKENISEEVLIQRIHGLARAEHARWNAFYIVNNWRYGKEKNEKLKTHDCLLSWQDLEVHKPETIPYDYKNVYHIAESVLLSENNKA
jgi:hypothetical protein